MNRDSLPQQRIVPVRNLPPRPAGLEWHHEGEPRPRALERATHPRKALYLFEVEWSWSPMHHAIKA